MRRFSTDAQEAARRYSKQMPTGRVIPDDKYPEAFSIKDLLLDHFTGGSVLNGLEYG